MVRLGLRHPRKKESKPQCHIYDGLRMVNWKSQAKTPPQKSGRRTHLLHCTYSYCILSRVWKLTLHCLFYVTMNIYFCFYVDVVTVLLIFAEYLSLYPHIFKCTYRSTHAQAHMYNQHTRQMATTMHRSLVWRGRRKAFVRDKGLAHTTKRGKKNGQKNPTFTNLKKKIRAHRASSRKATRLFLTR